MKKRKVLLLVFILAVGIIAAICALKYNRPSDWNYEGQAVVLSGQTPYEFVEITDVVLDGELYGFGKYFLGDLRIGTIEATRYFKGNPESPYYDATGIMTMYRHNLALEGEAYFERRETRRSYRQEVKSARTFTGAKDSAVSMLQFYWFEWYGSEAAGCDRDSMQAGWLYFKKAGREPFVIQTLDYLIVPGVSTREEALAVLHENFDFIGMGNFEQYVTSSVNGALSGIQIGKTAGQLPGRERFRFSVNINSANAESAKKQVCHFYVSAVSASSSDVISESTTSPPIFFGSTNLQSKK